MISLSWISVYARINEMLTMIKTTKIVQKIKRKTESNYVRIYAIPVGGNYVAGLLYIQSFPSTCTLVIEIVDNPEVCDIIVDDIYDSGKTAKKYEKYGKPILVLFDKRDSEYKDQWIEFPWEVGEKEKDIDDNALRLLQHFEGDKEKAKEFIDNLK